MSASGPQPRAGWPVRQLAAFFSGWPAAIASGSPMPEVNAVIAATEPTEAIGRATFTWRAKFAERNIV